MLRDYTPASEPPGPGVSGLTDENIYEELARIWGRCSIQLHRVCKANGTDYFHLLQPNQYVEGSKPMGEEERKVAILAEHPYRTGVERGYPRLVAAAEELWAAGVGFHDLRMLFSEVSEPLYIDNCCHLSRTGNEILAKHVARRIIESYDERSARLVALSSRRDSIRITKPLDPVMLEIRGRFDDAEERLVSAAFTGTVYRSSDSSTVSVSANGELTAHRQGTVSILIRNGALSTSADVEASWEAVLDYCAGEPGTGNAVPLLDTGGTEPRIGNPGFRMRLSKVPGGARGVLVLLDRLPEPAVLMARDTRKKPTGTVFPLIVSGQPGQPGAGTTILELPIPDVPALRGVPTYWRGYSLDSGAKHGWSMSNGLVVTVR